MKTIQVDNYVADYIEEAAKDFIAFCEGNMDLAKAFYVNMTLAADITKHLRPILTKSELKDITRYPDILFEFALGRLRFKKLENAAKEYEARALPMRKWIEAQVQLTS